MSAPLLFVDSVVQELYELRRWVVNKSSQGPPCTGMRRVFGSAANSPGSLRSAAPYATQIAWALNPNEWGFPKLGAPYRGPFSPGNPTIWGSMLGPPYFRKRPNSRGPHPQPLHRTQSLAPKPSIPNPKP